MGNRLTRSCLGLLLAVLAVLALVPQGCDYPGLKTSATTLREEVDAIRNDLDVVQDPAKRARLQARLDEIAPIVQQLADAIERAEGEGEAWWELAEGLGLILTGGVGAVGVRALRRLLTRLAAQRAAKAGE